MSEGERIVMFGCVVMSITLFLVLAINIRDANYEIDICNQRIGWNKEDIKKLEVEMMENVPKKKSLYDLTTHPQGEDEVQKLTAEDLDNARKAMDSKLNLEPKYMIIPPALLEVLAQYGDPEEIINGIISGKNLGHNLKIWVKSINEWKENEQD